MYNCKEIFFANKLLMMMMMYLRLAALPSGRSAVYDLPFCQLEVWCIAVHLKLAVLPVGRSAACL
jgi:hypothetical protein